MAWRQLRSWRGAAAAVALVWLGAVSAAGAAAQELLVFAAASLKDALDAVIVEHPGAAAITASYAASSVLARLIELYIAWGKPNQAAAFRTLLGS